MDKAWLVVSSWHLSIAPFLVDRDSDFCGLSTILVDLGRGALCFCFQSTERPFLGLLVSVFGSLLAILQLDSAGMKSLALAYMLFCPCPFFLQD